jgi:transposase
MKNQTKIIFGIDVSKNKLDVFCKDSNEHFEVDNSSEGFDKLLKFIEVHNYQAQDIWIAFEKTGAYHKALETFCLSNFFTYFSLNALDLKRSMGLVRGKNDKIDSIRIAKYVYEKKETLKPSECNHPAIDKLHSLMSLRDLMVSDRSKYTARMGEDIKVSKIPLNDIRIICQQNIIEDYKTKIENLEKEIHAIIEENKSIEENYTFITSVVGIGMVTAVHILVRTNNFEKFDDPRKFACYCGIAPFSNSSGKSQGKTRISHLGDKKLKSLLDMNAKVAILYDPELRQYYESKIAQGKHNKVARNIVRNKLVYRIFAVVRKKSTFLKKNEIISLD